MSECVRTPEEIERLLDHAVEGVYRMSRWPGMTYEDGVRAALDWITDREEPNPLED